MSLYNAINGKHPRSKEILALLDLTEDRIERYRDCRIFPKTRTIQILARTGGENRDDYLNAALTGHPGYLSDQDAKFDGTYAVYLLKVPDEVSDATCQAMNEGIRWGEG
jgi:hypothetical protein